MLNTFYFYSYETHIKKNMHLHVAKSTEIILNALESRYLLESKFIWIPVEILVKIIPK